MTTTTEVGDYIFDTLSRPSTTKGAVLAHDGVDTFGLVVPVNDCDVLTSNSSSTNGVEFSATTVNSGSSFGATINVSGGTGFFMTDFTTNGTTVPLVIPESKAILLTVAIDSTGWAADPTLFNGGSISFTVGYVPANVRTISSNFIDYAGGPHLTINFTDINTVPNKYRSFSQALNVDTNLGDQVSIRVQRTLTTSAPTSTGEMRTFILFKGI